MAFYDPEQRRLVLELGITSPHRRDCERYLEEMSRAFVTRWHYGAKLRVDGRTYEHDWLQIESGVVSGIPTRCRAFALPELSAGWTHYLVGRCDVLAFLCRATVPDIDIATASLRRVREVADRAGVPTVVLWLDVAGEGPRATKSAIVSIPHSASNLDGHRTALQRLVQGVLEGLPRSVLDAISDDFGPMGQSNSCS